MNLLKNHFKANPIRMHNFRYRLELSSIDMFYLSELLSYFFNEKTKAMKSRI